MLTKHHGRCDVTWQISPAAASPMWAYSSMWADEDARMEADVDARREADVAAQEACRHASLEAKEEEPSGTAFAERCAVSSTAVSYGSCLTDGIAGLTGYRAGGVQTRILASAIGIGAIWRVHGPAICRHSVH